MIEGNRVRLRPITADDTDNILRWRNSPSVYEYFICRSPLTRETHQRWLETKIYTQQAIQFIIVEKETGMDVGSVYLRDIDRENHNAEFGIYIGEPTERQKGLGTEAASLICDYGFDALKLHRIYLRVLSDNEFAIRCYQRVGFRREGVFTEHVFDGVQYHDLALMGYVRR